MSDGRRLLCSACDRPQPWSYHGPCSACGGVVEVRYDLARVRIPAEGPPLRRFCDLLPLREPDARLDGGEGGTRCLHARELGKALGLSQLFIKVEGDNPTGSTKDRQAPVLVGSLRELGVRRFVTASTGNASTALARIAGRFDDLEVHVFVGGTFLPRLDFTEAANVVVHVLPEGGFAAAGQAARWFAEREGATLDAGFSFFGKREGLKTAFYEAAEQVPGPIDYYVQAVSSGMGVLATRQAARELRALGRIEREPRLVCVQEDTCDPMVRAWLRGSGTLTADDVVAEPAGLSAATLRGDPSRSYPPLREVVRRSGGTMVSVGSEALCRAREQARDTEGLELCFTSAMTVAAVERLRERGELGPDARVLLNATGTDRLARGAARADFRVERSGEGWVSTPESRDDASTEGVLEQVIEAVAVARPLPEGEVIDAGTVLLDGGLALDSVAVLELLLALEKRFGCQIASGEITEVNLATVGAVAELLRRKLAEGRRTDGRPGRPGGARRADGPPRTRGRALLRAPRRAHRGRGDGVAAHGSGPGPTRGHRLRGRGRGDRRGPGRRRVGRHAAAAGGSCAARGARPPGGRLPRRLAAGPRPGAAATSRSLPILRRDLRRAAGPGAALERLVGLPEDRPAQRGPGGRGCPDLRGHPGAGPGRPGAGVGLARPQLRVQQPAARNPLGGRHAGASRLGTPARVGRRARARRGDPPGRATRAAGPPRALPGRAPPAARAADLRVGR